MIVLPLDILECIVEQIYARRDNAYIPYRVKTLKAFSITCRALRRPSQKLLFRRSHIPNRPTNHYEKDAAKNFYLLLCGSPHLAEYICTLHYEVFGGDDEDAVLGIISILPNVEQFTLNLQSLFQWSWPLNISANLAVGLMQLIRSPKLRYLKFVAIRDVPISVLARKHDGLDFEMNRAFFKDDKPSLILPSINSIYLACFNEDCLKSLPLLLRRCPNIRSLTLEANFPDHLRGFGNMIVGNGGVRALSTLTLIVHSLSGSEKMKAVCNQLDVLSNFSQNAVIHFEFIISCGIGSIKLGLIEGFGILDNTLTISQFPKFRKLTISLLIRATPSEAGMWDDVAMSILLNMPLVSALQNVDLVINPIITPS